MFIACCVPKCVGEVSDDVKWYSLRRKSYRKVLQKMPLGHSLREHVWVSVMFSNNFLMTSFVGNLETLEIILI